MRIEEFDKRLDELNKRHPIFTGILAMAIYGGCQLAMFAGLFCLAGVCG